MARGVCSSDIKGFFPISISREKKCSQYKRRGVCCMRPFVRSYTGTQFPQSQEGERKSPETARDNALSSLFYVRAKKMPYLLRWVTRWNGMEWTLLGLFSARGNREMEARRGIRPKDITKKVRGIVARFTVSLLFRYFFQCDS